MTFDNQMESIGNTSPVDELRQLINNFCNHIGDQFNEIQDFLTSIDRCLSVTEKARTMHGASTKEVVVMIEHATTIKQL